MYNEKQVARNALISVVNIIITGVSLFYIYRFLLDTIGVEKLGVWSVVLATTSASRLGEFGLSGSIIKFVAKYAAQENEKAILNVIKTGFISILTLFSFAVCIFYIPLLSILNWVLPVETIIDAESIFPYAMWTVFLTAISGVFLSGLEGLQRADIKGIIQVLSNIVYLMMALLLVPGYGLLGMAYAQVVQVGITLLLSWGSLKRILPNLPLFRFNWDKATFLEMFRYGANFQISSLMQMLFEPITKSWLSKFGDISMVGYFEMANRMVMQFRSILVSAHQVLVPVISGLQETNPSQNDIIYIKSYRLLMYLSLPIYALMLSLAPVISELWIGSYEKVFVCFVIVCSLGWFINTLTNPAYFSNLGTGDLRWNTISVSVRGMLNTVLGFLLGYMWGGEGVVISWFFSLCLGSGIVVYLYHIDKGLSFRVLLCSENKLIAMACFLSILASWLAFYFMHDKTSPIYIAFVGLFIFFSTTVYPIRTHNMSFNVMNKLRFF